MKLVGSSSVRDLDRSFIEMPAAWLLANDRSGPPRLDEIDRPRAEAR